MIFAILHISNQQKHMNKLTYEPIVDTFPPSYTVEDLRSLYIKLQPLFSEEQREEKIIQIKDQ